MRQLAGNGERDVVPGRPFLLPYKCEFLVSIMDHTDDLVLFQHFSFQLLVDLSG